MKWRLSVLPIITSLYAVAYQGKVIRVNKESSYGIRVYSTAAQLNQLGKRSGMLLMNWWSIRSFYRNHSGDSENGVINGILDINYKVLIPYLSQGYLSFHLFHKICELYSLMNSLMHRVNSSIMTNNYSVIYEVLVIISLRWLIVKKCWLQSWGVNWNQGRQSWLTNYSNTLMTSRTEWQFMTLWKHRTLCIRFFMSFTSISSTSQHHLQPSKDPSHFRMRFWLHRETDWWTLRSGICSISRWIWWVRGSMVGKTISWSIWTVQKMNEK